MSIIFSNHGATKLAFVSPLVPSTQFMKYGDRSARVGLGDCLPSHCSPFSIYRGLTFTELLTICSYNETICFSI